MKKWYRQKAFWTGATAVASGIAVAVAGSINEGITLVFGGLATIFLRDSINKQPKS